MSATGILGDLDLLVILADPRLSFPYHPSGVEEDHDRRDLTRLTEALEELVGSERVTYLDDHGRLLDEIRTRSADLILNFCNAGFRNTPGLQMHLPALLEMLGIPFAGADAACLAVCHDKAAVNATAAAQGIPVPRQDLLRARADDPDLPRRYPALLKPNDGSGGEGITPASVVHDPKEAAHGLSEMARERSGSSWVVAEELLPGREFSMAVLGHAGLDGDLTCLPPLEVDYSKLPSDLPPIMTHASKADESSTYWQRLALNPADLPEHLRRDMERQCTLMFERLGCCDYARFDFRADDSGLPRLIDANAHPEWGAEGMVARMAGFAGLRYEELLDRIITSALHRTSPSTRRVERSNV